MGNCVRCDSSISAYERSSSTSTIWHMESFKTDICIDPSLEPLSDKEHRDLYNLLTEISCQRALADFAKPISKVNLLICWTLIEEFKHQEIIAWKRVAAKEIYDKYINPESSEQIIPFQKDDLNIYKMLIASLRKSKQDPIDSSSFADVSKV